LLEELLQQHYAAMILSLLVLILTELQISQDSLHPSLVTTELNLWQEEEEGSQHRLQNLEPTLVLTLTAKIFLLNAIAMVEEVQLQHGLTPPIFLD
jgi:hypothetical protein